MQFNTLVRRKKLDRGEHARPLVIPDRLIVLVSARCLSVSAPLELGLAVVPTHPHRFAPARRILNQPDNVGRATVSAATARERPTAQTHRELRARRIAGSRVVVSDRRGVPPADSELAPMVLAPAPYGGHMTRRTVPTTRTRTAFASRCAAEADERQGRRRTEVIELVEGRAAHRISFAADPCAALSHTLTRFLEHYECVNNFPLCR